MHPLQNCIIPTIRIGREILFLLYAGFFIYFFQNLDPCSRVGAVRVSVESPYGSRGGPIRYPSTGTRTAPQPLPVRHLNAFRSLLLKKKNY